jgi:hypothetical protein
MPNDQVYIPGANAPMPPAPPLTPTEIKAYLDYALEQLLNRRAEICAALDNNFATHPVIEDEETLGNVAENVRMASALTKTAKARHTEHKEPYLTGGRAVDAWFKVFAQPLEQAVSQVQAVMNKYGDAKLARERAAAVQARRLAEAEAARLAEIAAQRMEQGRSADIALENAARAADDADAAARRETAKPAALTRTYGTYGAVASVREKWSWEVEDLDRVPRKYLMVDAEPTAVIAGIRWVSSTKVGVR